MATKIFVNLPVKDLKKTMEFFKKLNFSFNPQFTDENASKQIADATKQTEAIVAIDAESREEVDELVQKAVDAGGSTYREPQDEGWMYGYSFADLDGHQWEVLYMDESKIPQTPGAS